MFGSSLPRRTCAVILVSFALAGASATAQERQRTVLTRAPQPSPAYAVDPLTSVSQPAGQLATARTIYVNSETDFCNSSVVEERLMADRRFAAMGYELTRDSSKADLIIKVNRTTFTTHFTYTLLHPTTNAVLGTGRASSLFGTASGRIAKRVIDKLAKARGVRK